MNYLKRWAALGLALAMTLALTSCQGIGEEPQTVSQQFDAYLEELPSRLLDADSMDLNFLFQTPQNYGIQPEPAVLPFDTQEEWEEDSPPCHTGYFANSSQPARTSSMRAGVPFSTRLMAATTGIIRSPLLVSSGSSGDTWAPAATARM